MREYDGLSQLRYKTVKLVLEYRTTQSPSKIVESVVNHTSAANVISTEFDAINLYEAEFAGLISNLGAFYMLYRAALYPPIAVDREKVKSIVSRYHEEAGLKILKHLDMPIDIMDAVETSPLEGILIERVPRSLREVVYIARIMADAKYLWRDLPHEENMVGSVFMELGEMIDQKSEENRKLYDR